MSSSSQPHKDQVLSGQCPFGCEKGKEGQRYQNIVNLILPHHRASKEKKQEVSWGAPTDAETNEALECTEDEYIELCELLEKTCADDTSGITKIDQ